MPTPTRRRIEPTIDFLVATDAGLTGKPDDEVLAIAAAMGRILATHDRKTMPDYLGRFMLAGGHSPGVFLIHPHRPIAAVIESLVMVWAASDAQEWVDRIIEIPL